MSPSLAIAILIAAIGVGFAMSRVAKVRKEMAELTEAEPKPKRQSRSKKRLEQIRAAEPEYVAPSIDDLIIEEVTETGVDRIPGGHGLEVAVRLKVFRRDTPATDTCLPERRRFVLNEGVNAADAGLDDVKLVCEDHANDEPDTETDTDTDTDTDEVFDASSE